MSETVTMTLSEFLLARIAEDEASLPGGFDCWYEPERYAAECEAKRRIAGLHDTGHECPGVGQVWWSDKEDWTQPCPTLRALAGPYADHPDYDPKWAQ